MGFEARGVMGLLVPLVLWQPPRISGHLEFVGAPFFSADLGWECGAVIGLVWLCGVGCKRSGYFVRWAALFGASPSSARVGRLASSAFGAKRCRFSGCLGDGVFQNSKSAVLGICLPEFCAYSPLSPYGLGRDVSVDLRGLYSLVCFRRSASGRWCRLDWGQSAGFVFSAHGLVLGVSRGSVLGMVVLWG